MYKRLTLALICAIGLCAGTAQAEPHLVFSGSVSVTGSGGLSALDLEADGQSGIALSDRGDLFAIRLERTDGVLIDSTLAPWASRSSIDGDIEGVAYNGDGPHFFSLEAPAGVIKIDKGGQITKLPDHADFADMIFNRELEALAIDKSGTIYTLPEKPSLWPNQIPLYAFENGVWQIAAHIPMRGFLMPVGADFGTDNLFYLLERSVSPLGFRTRVRRFDLSQVDLTEETLLTTGQLSHDNLEGISVWTDQKGATRVTMISDDNFLPILRSEVVEYILHE
ncbi:esterase-like activity of phytase family protein [bacterium]|nr:esterase-like activity of phytase family protein [bacterium]